MATKSFEELPNDILLMIFELLSPNDRFILANISIKIRDIIPHCKTWIFSTKTSKTMTKFNNTVRRVETFKILKRKGQLLVSSIYALAMFHKNLKHFQCDDIKSESIKHLALFCKGLKSLDTSSVETFLEDDLRSGDIG